MRFIKHEVLVSDNMVYTYEPELKEFYDFSRVNYMKPYQIDELDLSLPKYDEKRLILKY